MKKVSFCAFFPDGRSRPISAGIHVTASKNEETRHRITVMAIAFRNSPTPPGIRAKGINASTLVSVLASRGAQRCPML